MKKILFIILAVITFVAISIFLLYILNFNISRAGSRDELRSVKESKEYGVIVSEYHSPYGYIEYPDNQKLYIKESWIEYNWVYNYWKRPIINKEVYGLYIVFKEPFELNIENRDYIYQWKNGQRHFDGKSSDFRGILPQFSIWSKNYKNEDTLEIFIVKYYSETRSYDTVSSFILVKKNDI